MITVKKLWFDDAKIFAELSDGRTVGIPVKWFPNLSKGTPEQLLKYELWNDGQWIHWEELDEDLSAEGFLSFYPEKPKIAKS